MGLNLYLFMDLINFPELAVKCSIGHSFSSSQGVNASHPPIKPTAVKLDHVM